MNPISLTFLANVPAMNWIIMLFSTTAGATLISYALQRGKMKAETVLIVQQTYSGMVADLRLKITELEREVAELKTREKAYNISMLEFQLLEKERNALNIKIHELEGQYRDALGREKALNDRVLSLEKATAL